MKKCYLQFSFDIIYFNVEFINLKTKQPVKSGSIVWGYKLRFSQRLVTLLTIC